MLYRDANVLCGRPLPDPTRTLRLPPVRGGRDRVASADEAAVLLAALPAAQRAPWGLAFYAGLRHGEVKALTWEAVDLPGGVSRRA